jgi:hypothetical protein
MPTVLGDTQSPPSVDDTWMLYVPESGNVKVQATHPVPLAPVSVPDGVGATGWSQEPAGVSGPSIISELKTVTAGPPPAGMTFTAPLSGSQSREVKKDQPEMTSPALAVND